MTGEIAALTGAVCWAVASIIFAEMGIHVQAINLNLLKGLCACLMMCAFLGLGTLLNTAGPDLQGLASISGKAWVLLTVSGIAGIGIGDTAYFACLKRIGPQKGLMLESTAPLIASVLALIFFHEILAFTAWIGIFITTLGVILVVRLSPSVLHYRNSPEGISLGLLAATLQATGIVLSRMALAGGQAEPLASALIRLVAGLLAIAAWLMIKRAVMHHGPGQQSLAETFRLVKEHHLAGKLVSAVFIGTFCALWLQQLSVRYTSAGIAQTIFATCPLFAMLIGVAHGQRQPRVVWAGLLLGFSGVSLLFLS